jgi:hypothetical protein
MEGSEFIEALEAMSSVKHARHASSSSSRGIGVRRPQTKRPISERAGPALKSQSTPTPTTNNGEIDVAMRAQKLKEFSQTARGQFAAVFQSLTRMPSERIFANALGFNVPVQSSHLLYVRQERNLERNLENDVEEDDRDSNKTREQLEGELRDFPSGQDQNTTVQRRAEGRSVQLRRDEESVYLRQLRDQATPYLAAADTVTFTSEVLGAIITAANLMGTAIYASLEFKEIINSNGYEALIFNDANPPLFITLFAQLAGWSYNFSQHVSPRVRTFKDQEKKILPLMKLTLDQIQSSFRFANGIFIQKTGPDQQSISNMDDPFFRGLLSIQHSEL